MIDPSELTSNRIFDPLASGYGDSAGIHYINFLEMQLLEKYSKVNDTCLDIGAADGIFSIPLARRVREVYAIDISPNMLAQCRRNSEQAKIENIRVYERSATDLQFRDCTFDLVYSFATLLLVPHVQRAFREIVRVLKPGGYAVLDIAGKYNLSSRYWERFYKRNGHWGLNAYALPEITAILLSLGFETIEIHSLGFLDQWKYMPGKSLLGFLDRVFHKTATEPDLDYRISQKIPSLANRWFIVFKRVK